MIQDIAPDRMNIAYVSCEPDEKDSVLLFDDGGRLYVRLREGKIIFPAGRDVPAAGAVYLFSAGEVRYFLAPRGTEAILPGFEYRTVRELRDAGQGTELFAAFTAYHLWRWYEDSRCCGRCGGANEPHP